ncbi:MAG: hypothetical protein H7X77_08645 [Anaerolineae bacterium]|nr:hypothetical protein [Anaerolineae bacterium]
MFNTPIVEVAIGLIFIFSLMGLLVTQINTFMSNLLKMRAKQLRAGLQQLVQDDRLRAEIMVHPLVNLVAKDVNLLSLQVTPEISDMVNNPKAALNDVSYIAPGTFVEALIGILISRSGGDIYDEVRNALDTIPDAKQRNELVQLLQNLQDDPRQIRAELLKRSIAAVPDNATLVAAFQPLQTTLDLVRYQNSELTLLLNGVAQINNPAFREAINVILTTAKGLDDARKKLENWFNDGMTRTSEVYKRQIQYWSLLFALILAVLFNIDTLYLGQNLWQDPDLRRQVVATAKRIDPAFAVSPTTDERSTDPNSLDTTTDEGDVDLEDLEENAQDIGTTVQKILDLQLPIGWEYTEVTPDMITLAQELGLPDPRTNSRNVWNLLSGDLGLLLQKLLGILATTIAAAQGAPFWFDLLNRLTKGSSTSSNSSSNASSQG